MYTLGFLRQSDSCLCGVSVYTATTIFGIVCLFNDSYNFLQVLWILMRAKTFSGLGVFVLDVLAASFGSTILLLHGHRTQNAAYYWPFLVFQWFYVSMHAVCVVILSVLFVLAVAQGDQVLEPIGATKSYIFVFWITSMLFGVVRFYFGLVIVDRSRKLLHEPPLLLQSLDGNPKV